MPLNDNGLNVMGNALRSAVTHLALHSGNPGSTGTNQTSAARVAATWTTTSAGDFSLTASKDFTGGAANGAVTHVGLWSAATGGTFYGSFPVTGDPAFNSSGQYRLNTLTIDGSST